MKLSFLIDDIPIEFQDLEITGVTCDSRKVEAGFAFVCIKGTVQDGHMYADEAAKKGAAVIIAQRDTGLKNQIIVDNTRKVYASMCARWFGEPAKDLKLVGVTGTNGKTSVSYMLKSILEENGFKTGLIGTIQNMIGDEVLSATNTTPDAYELHSLLRSMRDSGCKYVVMEVSSHALDQDRVYGLEFESAVFTNLSQDHLDYHETMENYLQSKRKLFKMCKTAVINYDDPYSAQLCEGLTCDIVTYSLKNDNATYTAKNITYRPNGVDFEMVGFGVISRVRLKTVGEFSVYNAMCAGVCAISLGFPLVSVANALSNMPGIKGRAEVVPTGRNFSIIIDYAHTPDGLENILKTFADVPKNRLVVLFGCGGDRDKKKRPLMGAIAARLADFVIVTSDNPRTEEPMAIIEDILEGMKNCKTPYVVIENRIEAIEYTIENAQENDIIVLAGKGHETYQILKSGTIHLDEREIVARALANKK